MTDKLYDGLTVQEWIDELDEHKHWNIRHAHAAFALLGTPSKLLDVGCGTGHVVEMCRTLGIEAYGCDQLVGEDWPEHFFHANLEELFSLSQRVGGDKMVNMVFCWEVAEHIRAEKHHILCDVLANHLESGKGNYLLFTSAYPGQGGIGHLSERPAKYWHDAFSVRGLNFNRELTINLALLWSHIKSPLYWLASNIMVFEK